MRAAPEGASVARPGRGLGLRRAPGVAADSTHPAGSSWRRWLVSADGRRRRLDASHRIEAVADRQSGARSWDSVRFGLRDRASVLLHHLHAQLAQEAGDVHGGGPKMARALRWLIGNDPHDPPIPNDQVARRDHARQARQDGVSGSRRLRDSPAPDAELPCAEGERMPRERADR
jgi:hypothetical protein